LRVKGLLCYHLIMLEKIINFYEEFLSVFPSQLHFWISLAIFVVIIIWFLKLMQKNIIWIILLVLFIPASIPLLKQIGQGILEFLQYLLNK